jgi:isocitrate lyase
MQGNGAVNIRRDYSQADVDRLAGSFPISHTLAERGAARPYVPALGALTGNQAIQQVKGGLKAIYLSGWQVAADANAAGQMYPDLSLYPADSVPDVVRRINNALRRADQIAHLEDRDDRTYWMASLMPRLAYAAEPISLAVRKRHQARQAGRRHQPSTALKCSLAPASPGTGITFSHNCIASERRE